MTGLVRAAAAAGDARHARALAVEAEAMCARDNAPLREPLLTRLVKAVAAAGDLHYARTLVVSLSSQDKEGALEALQALARAEAAAGDVVRVQARAAEAEAMWATVSQYSQRWLVGVVATADLGRARALIRSISDSGSRAYALGELTREAAQAGNTALARVLASEAESLARSFISRGDPYRAGELVHLVQAVAVGGDVNRARALEAEAEALCRSADPQQLVDLVAAVAAAGDLDWAETLTRSIDPYWRASALAAIPRRARPGMTQSLIAQALRAVDDWDTTMLVLETLPLIHPAALVAIADDLDLAAG